MARPKKPSIASLVTVLVASFATAAIMFFGETLSAINGSHYVHFNDSATHLAENSTVIGGCKTISQSTDENRAENLAVAAQALDGMMVMPGETLSLNKVLGNTSTNPAYREAAAISGTDIVSEQGGGICQVASALYAAALQADMEVVERHPHTVACDYAPMGLDATLAYGQKDLKIRNASESPLQIAVSAEGQTVTASITGAPLADGSTINVHAEVVGRRTLTPDGADAEFGLDAASADDGSSITAFDVEAYKVRYVDGKAVQTALLSADTYLYVEGRASA